MGLNLPSSCNLPNLFSLKRGERKEKPAFQSKVKNQNKIDVVWGRLFGGYGNKNKGYCMKLGTLFRGNGINSKSCKNSTLQLDIYF